MSLPATLRNIVERAFDVSQDAYAAELATHNAMLGLTGDVAFTPAVRPKFFTGNPDALEPGRYLLALSLNHKYSPGGSVDEEIAALNAGPIEHYDSCANYFERYEPYRFFRAFTPVVEGMGFRQPLLGVQVFFMDALPYFSAKSRGLSTDELRGLVGKLVSLNREAVRAVVTTIRPAVLFLNGKTAFSALAAWCEGSAEWHRQVLANQTRIGPCEVQIAHPTLFGVPLRAVRSNFLGKQYGPNSNSQRRELGALLAGEPPTR